MEIREYIQKNGQNIKNDIKIQNAIINSRIFTVYLKNNEFNTFLLRFSELSTFFVFSLNNKKYNQSEFQKNYNKINYKEFLDDFYTHININDNFTISLLPENIYSNIIIMAEFVRNFRPDSLMEHLSCTKAIIYFSLIFSCNANLIQNPHFRMTIFDIMIYFFILNDNEKNNKINKIFELLKEKFIKESLMVSILKVFVDAERLGTSNQFYEKFSVRHKILYLIDNINKGYGQLFEENIKDYTEKYPEESTKMINSLMSDITFLNDGIIENLSDIKQYQDLIGDVERYNNMTDENKKYEESKFKEKDRIVKPEINLFNSGLKFLVSISKVLQSNFEKSNLCQNLANLLNYSLNIFITPRGNEIKVKNLNQYDFDPKFILASILTIYSSFVNSEIFIEYVVKDERSYKYENFEKALNFVRDKRNIPIKGEDFDNYEKIVKKIKEVEAKIKSEEIDYDDAPEEFLDAITTILMDDPVKLPTSHVIVDRKTIEHHLLSDQTDPFNRTKLTKDMLIPCPELKAKIDEYKKKKKKSHDNNQKKMDIE
jgi:ubiquitin conjugation factor E4 B